MERTDELMEKFFAGTSTLEEEQELKEYFLSGNIRAEHAGIKFCPVIIPYNGLCALV